MGAQSNSRAAPISTEKPESVSRYPEGGVLICRYHSAPGNLYYFYSVKCKMLMIQEKKIVDDTRGKKMLMIQKKKNC